MACLSGNPQSRGRRKTRNKTVFSQCAGSRAGGHRGLWFLGERAIHLVTPGSKTTSSKRILSSREKTIFNVNALKILIVL